MLDDFSLRVIFALNAVTLLVLFVSSFHRTRSRYSLGWTAALAFLLAGSALFLLIGTSAQMWAIPVGNALTVVGLVWAWWAVRSLKARSLRWWHFAVPAVVVGIVTVLDDPAVNDLAGFLAVAIVSSAVMGLAARDLFLLDGRISRSRRSLLIASTVLSIYYGLQAVVDLAALGGVAVPAVLTSDATTTVITQLVLVVVSFSMAELSHDEAARRLRARTSTIRRELSEGAQVQRNLMPDRPLTGDGFSIAGVCVPSRTLSGDFFDWEDTGDHLVITVGDVMGKGAGAAMLGATVRAGLRLARTDDPGTTVPRMMKAVGDDLARNNSFVTLFHAHLDHETGRLTVLDAGHGLAVVVRADGSHEPIRSANLPLGLNNLTSADDTGWTTQTLSLDVGDKLLIFSDGVLDLFDGSLASMDLAADLALRREPDTGTTSDSAVDRIRALAERTDRDDDVTVVTLDRLAPHLPAVPGLDTAESLDAWR
ncbi:SpoIIE family protein phosphatase [Herbiconiux sp. CPCC 203407]|uniref:SpoIIE family protein phosphatase n=1 Tax=Herbiconiux oxytropis TaxID=2970915 RepID=A0AA42BVU4_9MICO|nr:SpoIIE family protein phosphatase [Herbiconiux oxytropis]MCS5724073.1 SpoIIE family protein phosphatase [Herbiconiux oxytropis]MCS5726994.1 SpoIIE family protein phosphatase [Herbiconiux oxytropis]